MLASIFSGWDDLIVILVAVVVLFGGTQLPKLARNTGEALREFRKAHNDGQSDPAATDTAVPATPVLPQTALANGSQTPTSDSVTLTKAQLDALVAERVAQSQTEGRKAGS